MLQFPIELIMANPIYRFIVNNATIPEPKMTRHAMSLMDVLVPPGNTWLKELSRRKTDLPAGVQIVRFGEGDDDCNGDDERGRNGSRQEPATA